MLMVSHVFRIPLSIAISTAIVTVSLSAWAGAGHGKDGNTEIGTPGHAKEAARTLTIDLADNYFDHEKISVKEGETIRFVLKNSGDVLHEFNIGTPSMHMAHQKEMEEMAEHGMLTATKMLSEMPHMDHSQMGQGMPMMKHDDPNSVLIGPGKTKEMTWTFGNAQNLEFACNIPGHYDSGMVGNFKLDH